MIEIRKCDVVIVGGGPAGLAAAVELYQKGITDVLILEREKTLGGILRQCIHDGFGLTRFGETLSGPEYAQRFIDQVEKYRIPYRTETTVLDITGDKVVTAVSREGFVKIQASAVILAMGCRERTRGALAIPGERPAGVFTAGVAQAYMNLYNRMVGREAVILGSGDIGLIMARRLTLEGAHVQAVFEIQPVPSGLPRNVQQCLNDYEIPLYLNHTITEIHGRERVTGVTVSEVDEHFRPIPGTEKEYSCDTVILSVGLIPENELAAGAGIELDPGTQGAVVDEHFQTKKEGFFAAGNVLHVHDLADYVSLEAEELADSVAEYVRKGGLAECKIMIRTDRSISHAAAENMTAREFTCIICPNGCQIQAVFGADGVLIETRGAACPRGDAYVKQELTDPRRTIASSVRLLHGELPLASVRLNRPIPRDRIFDVMKEIQTIELEAPVKIGDCVIADVLGLGSDVVVTKNVARMEFEVKS